MAVTPVSPGLLKGIRVLDLTQFEAGTHPGERLGAGRAGLELRQVEDADALE